MSGSIQATENEFVDLLEERRKDYDIIWASRCMKPQVPHLMPHELIYTRKQAIEATLADHRVHHVICRLAKEKNVPESKIVAEAHAMLEEMASKAHLPTVRWLGLIITKVLKRILISIRLNERVLYKMKDQMCISEVQYIYAPTHRSYLDFILLSYILFSYDMALPNIASGMDFYRMRIVGELLRHTGAFYMRRSFSSDPLYKEIFRAYVNSLVSNSDRAIEFFIEGTRSRCQKTLPPKYGLLSTILDNMFRSKVPDIQFIPISISYDKPLEELLFVYELLGVPKPEESTTGLLRSLSILREPFAHGNVYLKIAPPISARDYVDLATRRISAFSPQAKLPPEITKRVAYAIIDCHKRNTVLTPFNLISVLYNERIHSHPEEPCYSFNDLLNDYRWIKNILVNVFKATVNPPAINTPNTNSMEEDVDTYEILESLKTHKNLIEIDSEQNLKLKNRHVGVSQLKDVKGHPLNEETLKIAVPVINLMLYVNPIFAYLSKPAIAALCINLSSTELAIKRYSMLRTFFTSEFAFTTNLNESELLKEWEETAKVLSKNNYIQYSNENQLDGDKRFCSILCNLIIPFVASLHITCMTLLQWEKSVQCAEKNVIKECQRRVEESLYQKSAPTKHPYSLSLDIYAPLLSSLVACGSVTLDKNGFYKPDKSSLEAMLVELDDILKLRSGASYLDAVASSLVPEEIPSLRAKL